MIVFPVVPTPCVAGQQAKETSLDSLTTGGSALVHWDDREAETPFSSCTGLALQARQHAEKAKEILANSIVPPGNDNTDVFRCSIELFHTTGRALLALQKYPFASTCKWKYCSHYLYLILKAIPEADS